MTIVILPCGRELLIDAADLPVLEGWNWYADKRAHTLYVRGRRPGATTSAVYLHNLIMGGRTDHINANGLDNRRVNLRRCTQAQNGLNKRPKAGKKFKGVCRCREKFYAEIYINRTRFASRMHETEEDAARAYDALAVKHHGEWAWLNFPDEAKRPGEARYYGYLP